jgi:hypothetical protein
VLFRWDFQNGPQSLIFFQLPWAMIIHLSLHIYIVHRVPQFIRHNKIFLGSVLWITHLFISMSIGKVQISLFLTVTPEQIIYKEYLVYDAIGMIGSIGGSLGLCIGFSIFDTLCMFVDFVLKKMKRT